MTVMDCLCLGLLKNSPPFTAIFAWGEGSGGETGRQAFHLARKAQGMGQFAPPALHSLIDSSAAALYLDPYFCFRLLLS
jgi:hypothetical protein